MKTILLALTLLSLAIGATAQPATKPATKPGKPAKPAVAKIAEHDTIVTKSGLSVIMLHRGKGLQAKPGQFAIAHYTGRLDNDTIFDSSIGRGPFAFRIGMGQVIRGWDEAFVMLRVGDKARLVIPASLAYGERERPGIPANSRLTFDVELLELHEKSVGDTIQGTLDREGVLEAQKLYTRLKKGEFAGLYLSEDELNRIGYKYLGEEKYAEAIAIFKMNVRAFPKSGNVYDSLGEALMKSGDKEGAIANYKRSLELDPSNTNAADMLKKLQAK
jgi:hypothetical protein